MFNKPKKLKKIPSETRYMKKFSQRYDVPNLHPHKLRHTLASIAITNGADVASISEKLGRDDLSSFLFLTPYGFLYGFFVLQIFRKKK